MNFNAEFYKRKKRRKNTVP